MRSTVFVRIAAGMLAIVLLTSLTSFAKDGRDFAGYFSVGDVSTDGDMVHLTLNLQVFNYSAVDVRQAVIKLHESGPGVAVDGAFRPIKLLANNHEIKLRQQLTVPRHEYERWQNGIKPSLFMVYQDAGGHHWERSIELSRRPPPFPF
ncbi:MAG TPA: hypothetical protein VFB28_08850 [Terriglobales bacterium]|nr:hypothetical protein [Terriglobales bacterium]